MGSKIPLITAMIIMSAQAAWSCTAAIDQMQSEVDARIATVAGSGPSAPESRAATMHHQPTPQSLVAEEVHLGEGAKVQAALAALARARVANAAGDRAACEFALTEAQTAIRP